ncbi:hypothetical protein [[Clostridium] polysaccharolyticum]|nr:hypothetical protein [[Clostridium] polysaccharolyticum]
MSKEFWNLEHESNNVRKKDISNLPYIRIDLSSLPIEDSSDPVLQEIYQDMSSLSDKKIINLNGISNTDLKLAYGPANLEKLSEYDMNFTTLIRTISKWGQHLYQQNRIAEAQTVLEFGIACKTDIKNNYVLLAQIYHDNNQSYKINELLEQANSLNTLMKSSILSSLEQIRSLPY